MAYAMEQQEKLRRDVERLHRKDRNKDEFMATLAHELKNPLTPILTGISYIENSTDPEDREKIIKIIRRQMNSVTAMIDDLLDVTRISKGKIAFEKKPISIYEVLGQAIHEADTLIMEKGHMLNKDLPSQTLLVYGDRLRLSQVFVNILSNAAKYTPQGGTISISSVKENGHVLISIADNGEGIPKEEQDQIFDMFNQVEDQALYAQGGLGIGLNLVKRLVTMHEGTVSVVSEGKGKGSTFTVSLPDYVN